MTRILVVDNYDSFVFNLVQYLEQLGAECIVRRNDEITTDEVDALWRRRHPAVARAGDAGRGRGHRGHDPVGAERRLPVFGVCLGHQAIAEVYGGVVDRAEELLHGRTSQVHHDGTGRLRRPARPVHGHPLPLAGRRRRDRAGRPSR